MHLSSTVAVRRREDVRVASRDGIARPLLGCRVLLAHSGNEAFVKIDRDALQAAFQVEDLHLPRKYPRDGYRLWRAVKRADVVFCWFASWNSLWTLICARALKKPSVLVIGGYDIANLPEANYGHQRGGVQKSISRAALRLASRLMTNSHYSQREAETNAGIPREKVHVLYHGIPDPFGSLPEKNRERVALTVGKVDFSNLQRKGLQAFVQAAAHAPDVQFIVVGAWADQSIDFLRGIATDNVQFTGRVEYPRLLEHYRLASVYVQASLHEGFGMSVAEGMMAGCIPVVTRAGALPEVVGDCGFYCESPDPIVIADNVRQALALSLDRRALARNRVLTEFSMEKRERGLVRIVGESAGIFGSEVCCR